MRVIEVNMEQRRNEGAGETGDLRENLPTNGIAQQDSHLQNSGTSVNSEMEYTYAEKGMILMCGRADSNLAAARRSYVNTLTNQRRPIDKTFQRLYERLRETADDRDAMVVFMRMVHEHFPVARHIVHWAVYLHAVRGKRLTRFASHQGEPGSVPGRVTGLSQVGIVPDDSVGRRVFSGISRSPPPFRRLSIFTSITLIGSQDLAITTPRTTDARCPMSVCDVFPTANRGAAGAERLARSPPTTANWSAGILGDLPFTLALAFRHCSILTSLHPHRLSRPRRKEPSRSLHSLPQREGSVVTKTRAVFQACWSVASRPRGIHVCCDPLLTRARGTASALLPAAPGVCWAVPAAQAQAPRDARRQRGAHSVNTVAPFTNVTLGVTKNRVTAEESKTKQKKNTHRQTVSIEYRLLARAPDVAPQAGLHETTRRTASEK
ncbi:hypothetical protein PR048_023798 [Dryococelus australis]|uniref:Uncharacterized protein n=1 Tax=Dryococelus australis TaxID=614101 RepID=A0ABQ9GV42_9NEOP|nr:hypothetical protein PR048_023798 [Dryococelus australis]